MFPDTSAFHAPYFRITYGEPTPPVPKEQYRVEIKDCEGDNLYVIGETTFEDKIFHAVSDAMMAVDSAVKAHKGVLLWAPLTITVVKVEQTGVIENTKPVLRWS